MSEFKKKFINGALWSVFGQFASLLIVLITNIWLARILSPKEFGQVGVIMFFITLSGVFTESGLGGALVRKKEASNDDYSTVFVTNLVISIFCFFLIFYSAEYVASYYNDEKIEDLLIVAAVVLIINAFQLTQNAKLISDLRFKQKSIYRFFSVLIASSIGVYLAHRGLGVWSLVLIQILTSLISTVLLWIFEGFFVRLYFSRSSFKELYAFGVNTTAASLLNTAFDNVYQIVLAKYFSLSQTGYFYQAKKLQDVPGGIINMIANSVLFASLAKLQDDTIAFTKVYNKMTLYFLIILGFTSSFVYIYAESIVLMLYGVKWINSVFYIQLLTIASFFYLQENINKVVFKVFNQTKQILYLEYLKKSIQAVTVLIGVYYLDLKLLLFGFVITNIFSCFVNYYYSRRLLFGGSKYILAIVIKTLIVSMLTIAIIFGINKFFQLNNLFFTLPIFLLMYFGLAYIFKIFNISEELKAILKIYVKK